MRHHLVIIEDTIFACCDIIAQLILVRTTADTYDSIYSLKPSKLYRCWIVCGVAVFAS